MYCRNKIIIWLFTACLYSTGMAQSSDSDYQKGIQQQTDYLQRPIAGKPFDKETWKKAKEKVRIKEYKQEKKKEKKKTDTSNLNISPALAQAIKWSLFAILIGALLYLVIRVLGINPFNRKADSKQINISLEELEENLDTAAIDPHLYAAIKDKDFKLAIRLYYLMIIQKLAMKDKIVWKKHKTNKHYLQEMRTKAGYPVFRSLTHTYERCWFGDMEIDETAYDRIQPDFVNFLQNIK